MDQGSSELKKIRETQVHILSELKQLSQKSNPTKSLKFPHESEEEVDEFDKKLTQNVVKITDLVPKIKKIKLLIYFP